MTERAAHEIPCDEFDELVSELVLDLLAADERDRLLRHADSCARCRGELHSLTEVADLLPTLAPECEPPVGFESRVLAAVTPVAPHARLRGRVLLSAAAALLVAVGVGAWMGAAVTGDDSPAAVTSIATGTLQSTDGTDHGWVVLSGSEQQQLTMHLSQLTEGTYRCLLEAADGTVMQVAAWPIGPTGWGQWTVSVDARLQATRVLLLDAGGATVASAELSITTA